MPKATIFLSDHAEVVNGKLYTLGGAWTSTTLTQGIFAAAICVIVDLDEDAANASYRVAIDLADASDGVVRAGGENQPVEQTGTLTKAEKAVPGTRSRVVLSATFIGFPLPPGQYQARFHLEGQVIAREPFEVVASSPS